MTNKTLTMAVFSIMLLNSCAQPSKNGAEGTPETTTTEATTDEIVKSTSTGTNGKTLDMTFNNTKNTATLVFEGQTIELEGQKPASGIWYKNDQYELTGKGNDIELKKDGAIIFEHKDGGSGTTDPSSGNKDWWVDKTFKNDLPVEKDPRLGGPDFLIINSDHSASFKVGDIVEEMSWTSNGNSIVLKFRHSNKEINFKISDSYLTDNNGTKWTVKK